MHKKPLRQGDSVRALAELKRLLEVGVEGADGRLPNEFELAERLGADRRAVRRALDVLEAEGGIRRRPGRAAYVGPSEARPSVLDAGAEILEARLRIEPALAGLAAMRVMPDDLRRMRHAISREIASHDDDGRELWGAALHRAVAAAARNRLLFRAFSVIEEMRTGPGWRAWRQEATGRAPEAMRNAWREHRRIVEAIEDADPDGAEEEMRAHLLPLCLHRALPAGAADHAEGAPQRGGRPGGDGPEDAAPPT